MNQLPYMLADIVIQKEIERHLFGLLVALNAQHPKQIKRIDIDTGLNLVFITIDSARAIFEMKEATYINYKEDLEHPGSYIVFADVNGICYQAELESLGQYNALVMEFMG